MRMKSDIVPIFEAIIDQKLDHRQIEWHEQAAVCVVLAAGGYPGHYAKGITITGLDKIEQLEGVMVFHAGTELESSKLSAVSRQQVLTNGGRVLGVTALGDNIKFAIQKAYQAVDMIHFKGMHYRKDIGKKALKYLR
jgi:phosphoribosylamine--glycine ligase